MRSPFFRVVTSSLLNKANYEANGRGEITPQQRQNIQGADIGSLMSIAIPAVIAGFMLFFFLPNFFGVFNRASRSVDESIFTWVIPGLMVLVFIIIIAATAAPAVARLFTMLVRWPQVQRDLQNNSIRIAQGTLAYANRGYVFRTGERDLATPTGQSSGLLPGTRYNVYYLEESGIILSAMEIAPATPTEISNALQDILAQVNGFSLEDLNQNRNGEIAPGQRMKPLAQAIFGGIFGLVALGMGAAVFFTSESTSRNLPTLIMPAVILGIFLLVGGWLFVNAALDMTVSPLDQVEGEGRKESRRSGGKNRRTNYYYMVNNHSFQVNFEAYNALVDGQRYRVYYLPRTRKLLSIEVLGSGPEWR